MQNVCNERWQTLASARVIGLTQPGKVKTWFLEFAIFIFRTFCLDIAPLCCNAAVTPPQSEVVVVMADEERYNRLCCSESRTEM